MQSTHTQWEIHGLEEAHQKGLGHGNSKQDEHEKAVTYTQVGLGTLEEALYPRHMTSLFSSTLQW